MKRAVASLPGYASVPAAAEVLHLAPRSVRDLIYAGRLPSVRVGRRHYVRSADLELERRRRLGLKLPPSPARTRPHRLPHTSSPRAQRVADPARRRERAAERAAIVERWLERHAAAHPNVPFTPAVAVEPFACQACGRQLRAGARCLRTELDDHERLCLTCGRRALNDWADQRRLEAAAARRMAQELSPTRASLADVA